jgi:hypothetical protein
LEDHVVGHVAFEQARLLLYLPHLLLNEIVVFGDIFNLLLDLLLFFKVLLLDLLNSLCLLADLGLYLLYKLDLSHKFWFNFVKVGAVVHDEPLHEGFKRLDTHVTRCRIAS